MLRLTVLSSMLVVAAGACVSSDSQLCGDLVCPADAVCDVEHHVCSSREEVLQCVGKDDRTPCTLGGQAANCQADRCLAMVCGNGLLDLDEVCDDANTAFSDGCSADCASNEMCGNGVVDFQRGEQCDDAGVLEHDGCSSVCTVEEAQWESGQPSPRGGAAATYDAHLDQILIFGGGLTNAANESVVTDEMYAWKGAAWARVPFAQGPSARGGTALAYHAAMGKTILVGGGIGTVTLADTWAWDGHTWTRLADLPEPQGVGVYSHAMAYDARRKRLVLFGGMTIDEPQSITYELDAQGVWSTVTTTMTPAARYSMQMAYDPERGRIVLYGGDSSTQGAAVRNDTWEYDGDWHPIAASAVAPYRAGGKMAFDRTSHRMILVGGYDDTFVRSNATYAYNGANSTMTTVTPAVNLVTARSGMSLADDGHGRLVMFGGFSTALTNETLIWDGSTWGLPQPTLRAGAGTANDLDRRVVVVFGGITTSPTIDGTTWELSTDGWRQVGGTTTALWGVAMTYDVVRHQTVRFGGQTAASGGYVNTTAFWNGSLWSTRLAVVTDPTPRARSGMAFDVAHSDAVLFGGVKSNGSYTNETWTWNGTSWMDRTPASATASPSARADVQIAYDRAHGKTVLFGGFAANGGLQNDTWLWDGTSWQNVSKTARPLARDHGSLVWNPARQRLVLYGGRVNVYNAPLDFDTWEWDGDTNTWVQMFTAAEPLPNDWGSGYMLLDGSGVGLVLGRSPDTITPALRTGSWRFAYTAGLASDLCDQAIDNDGDGLAGCDDPDCWMSCTPLCPPAPAGTTCDPASPHCGDGVCDPDESCGACGDCTCTPVCGDFVCSTGETGCLGDCP